MLDDDDFTYNSVDYAVEQVVLNVSTLFLVLDKAIPSGLVLNVDGTAFSVASASLLNSNRTAAWRNSGLSWSTGDTVSLSLTAPSTTPTTDADGVTTYWSDTLTAKAVDYGFGCGFRTGQPQCDAQLTDDTVTYHGTEYTIELVHVAYGDTLQLILSSEPKDSDGTTTERSRMALRVPVGDPGLNLYKQFLVKDATVSHGAGDSTGWTKPNAWVLTWTGSGLSWSEGESVSLSLVTLPAGGL